MTDTPDLAKLIDGSWYEEQYKTEGARYSKTYVENAMPEWAVHLNRYHSALVCAWLALDPKKDMVLDLGSGVGQYVDTWQRQGYSTYGVEISKTAVKEAKRRGFYVQCGDVCRLPFWSRSFTVAFSASLMEHIAPEVTAKALQETMRVARFGAHYIPLDAGDDPSHIHIQPVDAWVKEMSEALGPEYIVFVVDNLADPRQPLFLTMRRDDVAFPAFIAMKRMEQR